MYLHSWRVARVRLTGLPQESTQAQTYTLSNTRAPLHILTCPHKPQALPGTQALPWSLLHIPLCTHRRLLPWKSQGGAVPLIQILPACKIIQDMQGQNFTASRGWSKAPQLITGSYCCPEHKVVPAHEDTHTAPPHTLSELDEPLREVNSSYICFKQLCTDHLGQGCFFSHVHVPTWTLLPT